MPSLNNALLRVSIYRQGELVGREVFRERHIVIGRDPTMADLVIGSVQVSREHALLEHDGQHVFLHDLESTNGIYVNGAKVSSAEINPRDRVFVGEHLLRLELRVARPAERAASEVESTSPPGASRTPTQLMPRAPTVTMTLDLREAELNALADIPWAPAEPLPQNPTDEPPQHFPLAAAVLSDAVMLPDDPAVPMRVAVCKTRGDQVLDMVVVGAGKTYRAADPHVRERWGLAPNRRAPLWVGLVKDQCVVQMPVGQPWSLRRAGTAVTEAMGVREGWVRRRRGTVTLSVQRGELLLVEMGAATYHVRFIPVPKRMERLAFFRPRSRILLWAGALSAVMHVWAIAGLGLLHTPAWSPAWRPVLETRVAEARVIPPITVAPALARGPTPHAVVAALAHPPTPRVPGGSSGFYVFGMPDVVPSQDPTLPALAPGLTLKRAAAFLRGKKMGFGSLLPSVSGPVWHLMVDPSRPPGLSPAGQVDAAAILALVHQSQPSFEACYQKNTPADAGLSARIELSFALDPTGAVTHVEASAAAMDAALLGCMRGVMSHWRLPKRHGAAPVAATYLFVFKRVGFE